MPPRPEVAQTSCQVWVVEIQHQVETHHPCHAPRHIRIAAEVEVYLPAEKKRRQDQRGRLILLGSGVDIIHVKSQVIGQGDLLEQSHDE